MEKRKTAEWLRYVLVLFAAIALTLTFSMAVHATAEEGSTVVVKSDKSGVNVRSSADTGSAVVGQVNGGDSFTVVGVTTGTDGNTWYNISGNIGGSETTGYIRSDFVDVQERPQEEVVEPEPEPETPEPENTEASNAGSTGGSSLTTSSLIAMQPETDPPVIPDGFREVKIRVSGGTEVSAWTNDVFYIIYGSEAGGEPGWYLFDHPTKYYVRYTDFLLNAAGSTDSTEKGGASKGLVIILIVVIVILGAACGFMAFKLFGGHSGGYDYDDDDEDDDEDDDDDEDYRPARQTRQQPQRSAQSGQGRVQQSSASRGQAQVEMRERPERRSQEMQPEVRRSSQQPQRSRSAQGGEVRRESAGVPRGGAPSGGGARRSSAQQPMTRRQPGASQTRQSRPVVDDYDDSDE